LTLTDRMRCTLHDFDYTGHFALTIAGPFIVAVLVLVLYLCGRLVLYGRARVSSPSALEDALTRLDDTDSVASGNAGGGHKGVRRGLCACAPG
jgi:hypothetical protein